MAVREQAAAVARATRVTPLSGTAEHTAAINTQRRATQSVIVANKELAGSFKATGAIAQESAAAQVAAATEGQVALRRQATAAGTTAAAVKAAANEEVAALLEYAGAAKNVIPINAEVGASFKGLSASAVAAAEAEVLATSKTVSATAEKLAVLQSLAAKPPVGATSAGVNVAIAKTERDLARLTGTTTVATGATGRLARATEEGTRQTRNFSVATKEGERDLGKVVRGGLAGAGIFHTLGRSLAFASGGFLAFAVGASVVRKSIDAARELAIAQRQVNEQLKVGGKSWDQYGSRIDEATLHLSHLSGFTHVELLGAFTSLFRVTNNVRNSLHLTALAADVARGRHISLTAASNALAKAAGGSFSALRRLNIVIPQGSTKLQALAFVQEKYAGQARAGTSAADRFHATLVDTEEIIGQTLLPILTRYTNRLGDWLAKMNESGRLQRDVKTIVGGTVDVFKIAGRVIEGINKVTGGFGNTLKILITLKFTSIVSGWIKALQGLRIQWGLVATAARTAEAAETAALGTTALRGGAGSAAVAASTVRREIPAAGGGPGGLLPFLFGANAARLLRGGGTDPKIINRIKQYTDGVSKTGAEATRAGGRIALLSRGLRGLPGTLIALAVLPKEIDALGKVLHNLTHPQFGAPPRPRNQVGNFVVKNEEIGVSRQGRLLLADRGQFNTNQLKAIAKQFGLSLRELEIGVKPTPALAKKLGVTLKQLNDGIQSVLDSVGVITPEARNFARTGVIVPPELQAPGFQFPKPPPVDRPRPRAAGPFGTAKPLTQYFKQFQLNFAETLAQTQASLTRSTKDDVAVARGIVARIRHLIDEGRLHGKALVQALSLEASALNTIWSAEDAAAQARKQRVQAALENLIDPLKLEVQLSREQAVGASTVGTLKDLRASARRAIATGKLSLQQQKEAWDQIASVNQQIADAAKAAGQEFSIPTLLQIAEARAQALGLSDKSILLKMRAAARRALRSGKLSVQGQIDAWNEIASVNDQLAQAGKDFQVPLKLQLAEAKAQALGVSDTNILQRMKRAAEKALKSGRLSIQGRIDAYNEIASINEQLSSSAQSALGAFKQASTQLLTKGLGLTPDQRARLRARLSQLGPGGTVPGSGVGAAGFIIGPDGRPLAAHHTSQRILDRVNQRNQFDSPRFARFLTRMEKIADRPIHITLEMDGRVVENVVTRRQQHRRRRNPSQRRGPNAGMVGA